MARYILTDQTAPAARKGLRCRPAAGRDANYETLSRREGCNIPDAEMDVTLGTYGSTQPDVTGLACSGAVTAPRSCRCYKLQRPVAGVFGGWMWNYPAKKGGIMMVFCAMLGLTHSWTIDTLYAPDGWRPDYYVLAASLVGIGIGCALLAYHFLKGGEEDPAAKKKIMLVGMAVGMLVVAFMILDILRNLRVL